jgi:hypothetical protein
MYFFKFQVADWVKKLGVPQHHLRITQVLVDDNGQRWYEIFDTTLQRGRADYEWVLADQLEEFSVLVARAESIAHATEILERCKPLYGLQYAIPGRQDCESIQRFIHTGREADRWSPQVWTGIAAAVVLGFFFFGNN